MSESITIARPYAKAIFEHALDKGFLHQWSKYLSDLAYMVLDPDAADFIHNPTTTSKQHRDLLIAAIPSLSDDKEALISLVATFADHKRLMVLPDVLMLFEGMRAEHEKTLAVKVISYSELSSEQHQHLKNSLSTRLQRQVTLNIAIDKSLIGGAVIIAGDLVIDGSVRQKLNKLRTGLLV